MELGTIGEEAAERFLRLRGYRILGKNVRLNRYEIDLIVMKEDTIVFVEVKTRSNEEIAKGYEAVDHVKQARIRRAATLYLMQSRFTLSEVRFDVISVRYDLKGQCPAHILHFKNAF